MAKPTNPMYRWRRSPRGLSQPLFWILFIVLAGPLNPALAQCANEPCRDTPSQPSSNLRIYVDPDTGEIAIPEDESIEAPTAARGRAGANVSSGETAPPTIEPSEVEGGGDMIRLGPDFAVRLQIREAGRGRVESRCDMHGGDK